MSQTSEGYKLPTTTSQENTATGNGTPHNGNVSRHNGNDAPSHPGRRDDKAAALENELLERTARFNKERFVYIFVIVGLIDAFLGSFVPRSVFAFLMVWSLILLIGLANWLDFPWIIEHLTRWEHLFFRRFERKKDIETDIEPS